MDVEANRLLSQKTDDYIDGCRQRQDLIDTKMNGQTQQTFEGFKNVFKTFPGNLFLRFFKG